MRFAFALVATTALAACNVLAPVPALPPTAAVNRESANAPFLGASDASFVQAPVPEQWWKLYDDARLNALIEEALGANADLRVAAANLERAQASLEVADAAMEPTTSLLAAPGYQRRSAEEDLHPGKPFPNKFVYSTGASVSYQVDLYGQIARSIDAARADVGAAASARDAAQVTVVAETTRAYLDVCSSGREMDVAQRLLALQEQSTALTRTLVSNGRAGTLDAQHSSVQEDQVRATLPQLATQRRLGLYRLAVLTGRTPGEFPREVADCTQEPRLSAAIPVGDGKSLLRRRPDVRRAEFEVRSAGDRIGVAEGDLYPKISLGASVGSVGAMQSGFAADTFKFSLGPLITWEFPERSRVEGRIRGASAERSAKLAQFDGTVLTALKETESALEVVQEDKRRLEILAGAQAKAADAARGTENLFKSGRQGYLPVLDANRTLIEIEQSAAAAESKLATDQVGLFLALGGGWQSPRN